MQQRRAEFIDAMTRELSFALDSDHYADDPGNQKQPGRVKPKGRQTFGLIRHKAGQYVRSELHVSVLPEDYNVDMREAAAAKARITRKMTDPEVRLKIIREACAIGALAGRMWAYKWEYDPQCRKVLPRLVDGRRLAWAPGHMSQHDPRCPWFYEECRLSRTEIQAKKNWKGTDDLHGDAGEPTITHSNLPAGEVDLSPSVAPTLRPSQEEVYCTVVYWYTRGYKSESRQYKPGTLNELSDNDKFLACMDQDGAGCGYKSQTAGDLVDEGELDEPQDMPDYVEGGCPDCGGDLHEVSHTQEDYVSNSDNTLTIFAPYEGSNGKILWQGPWPHDTTTVPYVIYTCYVDPRKMMGQSETSLNWSPQMAHNLVMRLGLEHMLLAKPYMQVPVNARDYEGNRWEFGEWQGLGIYTDPLAPPGTVQAVQALGLPPAWATLERALDSELRQDLGSTDFAMSPEQTRDIPVGTIEIQQREGEVPILAQTARWQFEDGIGLQSCYEIMQAVDLDEEPTQVTGEDGATFIAPIRTSDLAKMRITITTDPNAQLIRTEDLDNLIKIAQLPRPVRRLAARRFNIPIEQLQQLERDEDAAMPQVPPRGVPPRPPGPPGLPLPGPLANRLGGGMPPAEAPALNGAAT